MIGDTSKATTREKRRIGKVINRPIEMLPYEKNGDSAIVFKADNYNDRELLVKELEYVDDKAFGYIITELEYTPTMTIDFADSAYNKIKLTGDLNIDNILNQSTGSDYMLILEQDEVGGHSISINDENIQLYLKGITMLSELDTSPNSLTYIKLTSVKGRLYGEVLDYSTYTTKENQSYFSFDVEIASSGDTFTLPINTVDDADQYVQSFTADWGDDSTTDITSYDDTGATHTYAAPGTYTITMTGKSELFAVQNVGDKAKIVKLNTFFGDIGFKKLNFYGCTNLTGNIPTSFKNLRNLVDCYGLFRDCSSLTGEIPEDMFWNSPNILNFAHCFRDTNSIICEIPEKLFWNNPKVTDFFGVFTGFNNPNKFYGGIPEKLFWNNPKVLNFGTAFQYNPNLTGSIPEKLFWYNPEVTNFYYLFWGCSGISGQIPEKLFWYNPEVTNFGSVFNQTEISGQIPEKLFWNNPKVTNFERIFYRCISLTSEIPEKLFWNNPEVSNFSFVFYESGVSGEIPEKLFWNNPEVSNFSFVFGTFKGWPNNIINDIPKNIFINNHKVVNFENSFLYRNNITGDGWRDIIEYTTQYAEDNNITLQTDGCFQDCTSLTDYNEIPNTWK